jgi:hypothetical protein
MNLTKVIRPDYPLLGGNPTLLAKEVFPDAHRVTVTLSANCCAAGETCPLDKLLVI